MNFLSGFSGGMFLLEVHSVGKCISFALGVFSQHPVDFSP